MKVKQKVVGGLIALGVIAAVAFAFLEINNSSLSLFSSAEEDEIRHAFQQFKKDYRKIYFNQYQEFHRYKAFRNSYQQIQELNRASEATNGPSATFGINQFSDLTPEEFQRVYLGYRPHSSDYKQILAYANFVTVSGRAEIDWRAAGKVNPVQNQGICGSPWAFSATGALEGIYMIKDSKDISFSEQQLIDCSRAEGNFGCSGGFMDSSFKYFMKYAAETETSYPYTASDQTCNDEPSKGVVKVSSYTDIAPRDEDALYNALAKQPISVAMDIQSIYRYKEGIITKKQCNFKQLNHAALLTGYKVDSATSTPYWEVKNSWGTDWGMQGYMRIQAFTGGEGACGIALENSYPSI